METHHSTERWPQLTGPGANPNERGAQRFVQRGLCGGCAPHQSLVQHPTAEQFRVDFQRVDGRTTPVPTSDDQRTRARLENLDSLIGLNKRWRDELKNEYLGAIRSVQQYRRKQERGMTEEELIRRLELWAEEAQDRIGLRPHAILEYFYNRIAAQRDPQLFLELWIENTGADPLTGE